MSHGRKISPAEVDFWLDTDRYSNFIQEEFDPSNKTLIFNIDMVKLASIRSAISNFVRILTRKPIPVYFCDSPDSFNYMGKTIYISAKINNKQEFDIAVGLALHEAAHTLFTNFDVVQNAWVNIPHQILSLSDKKNIRRASLEKFIKGMWNIIEDRYIDTYVFNEAPGYRGYYAALYEAFWNSAEVDYYLQSDIFRYPSLKSYDYRITNFTNESTHLLALPRLDDIARVIDISHIDRLATTENRIKTAFQVTEIVLDCIDKQMSQSNKQKHKISNIANPRDYFDFGDNEVESEGEGESDDVDVGKKMIEEISDIMSGKDSEPEKLKENKDAVDKISDESLDKEAEKEIHKIIEKQRKFLTGEIPKEQVTNDQKSLLDLIEKHGIILVRVDLPTTLPGNNSGLKVDCIVVQKMTKELVLSGQDVFPLCGAMKMGKDIPQPPEEVANAVKKGISLGTKLGRKLQIRAEVHPVKVIRKKTGKINKRLLHEAAFDAEDLFYKMHIEEHHDANLHITIDASSSMEGSKWIKTMTSLVAICKAASMVHNIHVTVSFRTTQVSGSSQLPYVVLGYDSKIDKFSKIRSLFPYLVPNGCTPEGLAFGAIMNLFEEITPDEEDRFFLNLSDGEPYYILNTDLGHSISYYDEVGVIHTKSQVDKIRRHGVEILSYFISDGGELKKPDENVLLTNFHRMYGRNAKVIDVESIVDLARTINGLFIRKTHEKAA